MSNFKQYRSLKRGEQIYVGADTSMGCSDNCVAQFFSSKYYDIPIVFSSPIIATQMTNELYPALNKVSQITGVMPLVAYERNNGGAFELERLATLNRQGLYDIFRYPIVDSVSGEVKKSDKLGWDTNTATRPQMLGHLKEAIEKKIIRIYDQQTLKEMFSFITVQHSNSVKAEAENGAHDDHVMALAIAYEMYLLYPDLSCNQSVVDEARERYQRSIDNVERNGY